MICQSKHASHCFSCFLHSHVFEAGVFELLAQAFQFLGCFLVGGFGFCFSHLLLFLLLFRLVLDLHALDIRLVEEAVEPCRVYVEVVGHGHVAVLNSQLHFVELQSQTLVKRR